MFSSDKAVYRVTGDFSDGRKEVRMFSILVALVRLIVFLLLVLMDEGPLVDAA